MTPREVLPIKIKSTVVNKSIYIKEALEALPNRPASEIVTYVKRQHNLDVTSSYVRSEKSRLFKKPHAIVKPENKQSYEVFRVARKLLEMTGSVATAKATLQKVEDELKGNEAMRKLYAGRISEIDSRFSDTNKPLEEEDKRNLVKEKRHIEKLLEAISNI